MDAYEYIKNAIIEGEYEQGKRLREEYLAKELNLSRTPVREALNRLIAEGLITRLNRGVSVREFSPEDIRQIYDLRALLEGYAASQAALHRSDQQLLTLDQLNESYEKMILELNHLPIQKKDIKVIVCLNQQFHKAIFQASKNDYIQFLITNVFVIPLVFRSFYWYDRTEIIQSVDFHKRIYEAIRSKDSERAKSAMLEHIYRGRDHVLRHLTKDLSN